MSEKNRKKEFPPLQVIPELPAKAEPESEIKDTVSSDEIGRQMPCFTIDTSTPIPTIKEGFRARVEGTFRKINPADLVNALKEWGLKPSDGIIINGRLVFKKYMEWIEVEEDEE